MTRYDFDEIDSMSLEQIEARIKSLDDEVRAMDYPKNTLEDVDAAGEYKGLLLDRRDCLISLQQRRETTRALNGGYNPDPASVSAVCERERRNKSKMERGNMGIENNEIEIRAVQKYLTGGIKTMNEAEQRNLSLSGAAAMLPVSIFDRLITSEKYSDLLSRAMVISEPSAGKIYVPIASNNSASWHTENALVSDASPTITKLELGGYELLRLMRISTAASTMTTGNFTDLMLETLASEVIEALEKSFIDGDGSGQPTGLDNLSWTTGTNQILTANSSTPISAANIASALALLPQKYARNAIVLCNSDCLYNTISLQKGTSEYAFSMDEGATRFMGKGIVVSEHMADDTIYIVDPKQLYVRFASPVQVEADRSSGFLYASIDLRALCVVDSAWNPAACVRVGLGA